MSDLTIEDSATRALMATLTGLNTRQRVIGNNLANIDTPGFKASEVDFGAKLAAATGGQSQLQLVATSSQHLGGADRPVAVEISTRRDTSQRVDGNNVDLEKEMEQLAETMLHYQASAQLVSRRLGMLRTVITGGRGA